MIFLKGKYAEGIVFTDQYEESGIKQIEDLLNQPFSENSNPRFMPDYHAGLGSVIGTTMLVRDEICPNLVGVDIGCGIRTEIFKVKEDIDFEKLDRYIRKNIPSGFKVHRDERKMDYLDRLFMKNYLKDPSRLKRSIGSLGGGNHYIEIGKDEELEEYVLTVHSGSRNLGLQVAEYYQKRAVELSKKKDSKPAKGLETLMKEDIEFDHYLQDMSICVEFARKNRREMTEVLFDFLKGERIEGFETIHNYIEIREDGSNILRKGAVSAYKGQHLTIPMNMRDGVLIAEGLGNKEWNYSAPHGAGRIMSRGQARQELSMKDYKEAMEGIFTTSISEKTLDEAPEAYKPMEDILFQIGETVKIIRHIRPIYNFKSA